MAQEAPLFYVSFPEAYSLRHLLATIRQEAQEGNLIFEPKRISYTQLNQAGSVLAQFELRPADLEEYNYAAYDADGKLLPMLAVGFKTAEMMKATKSIKKRDGVCIYMYPGKSVISVQPIPASTKDSGQSDIHYVPVIDVEHVEHIIPTYSQPDDTPTVKVLAPNFSNACTSMTSIKCTHVTAQGHPSGIRFFGFRPGKVLGRMITFGGVETTDASLDGQLAALNIGDGQHPEVRIPISTIKALSKINNLSSPGTIIKLTIEPSTDQKPLPLKIISPIGNYGTFSIYIRDSDI